MALMTQLAAAPAPLAPDQRILSLDVLRGFAVLGILVMNIQCFAMIEWAYMNPTAYGDLSGLNLWVWGVGHILADLKFMTLFSLLFGAGIALMAQRLEASGQRATSLHYRRIFWLFVIGLAHAYLIWYGDILVVYALCGVGVYWFRKGKPKFLLVLGLIALMVPSILFLLIGWSVPFWPNEAYQSMLADWQPQADQVQRELAIYRGSWLDQMAHRVPTALEMHTFLFLILFGWRAGGLMLIGMAFLKWGVLSAERSDRFYRNLWIYGWSLGLALVGYGAMRHFEAKWSLDYSMFLGSQFNYWGSLGVALGYVGLWMLLQRHNLLSFVRLALASVGRTALTNYLAQSLICTTLFYGHGLGLFGRLERWQQFLVVLAVWAVQIPLSVWWLRHFRYGPVEWLWRSLTYLRCQPWRFHVQTPKP